MWTVLNQSVIGTAHERSGRPCQDAAAARVVSYDGQAVLVVACADGAGSAARGEVGARVACDETMARAAPSPTQPTGGVPTPEAVRGWFAGANAAVRAEALRRGADARDLACTLLVAVVGERSAVFAQVGDGAIVFRDGSGHRAAFWPQTGEYANTTNFLTDEQFQDCLEVLAWPARVDELAVFTDGLQALALDYAGRAPHAPFFDVLFRLSRGGEGTEESLRQFLACDRVNARTDDDKTLVVATRPA